MSNEPSHSPQQYARLHRRHLEQHAPHVLAEQRRQGTLSNYLSSVGHQAASRFEALLSQKNNHPEVQDLPYQQRVERLQSHPQEANEVVMDEIVHQPRAD